MSTSYMFPFRVLQSDSTVLNLVQLYITANDVTAYVTTSTGAFDTKTVFEVTDEIGRLHRFKNTKERVHIQGASEYAFRNAPSFMSVLNTEVRLSDSCDYLFFYAVF